MPEESNIKDKKFTKLIYIFALFVTFMAAYIYTFDAKLAMLGDNASYYTLGKALAEGEGYVNIDRISHSPNNHYPPGYPTIISVVMLFSDSIFVMKIVNGIFCFLGLWVLFEIFSRITANYALSFVITMLALVNSHLLYYSSIMMSEIPFFLFSGISILCFIKADWDKLFWKDPYVIICIITLIFSYYIRSLGVALVGGYFLYFIVNKQWKALGVVFVLFFIGALPWFIRAQQLGGGSYMKQLVMINPYQPALGQADFSDFIDRFFTNFSRYVTREIPSGIFPIKHPDYSTRLSGGEWFMGLIILTMTGYGIFSLPKYRWLIGGYILGTLGILMIWPDVWIGVRFIIPIIPLLALGFFFGVYTLFNKVRSLAGNGKKSLSAYWLLVFAVLYISPLNATHEQAKVPLAAAWKNYFEVATWLKRNELKTVVVSTGKPSLFYLYSNTYTMRYKFAQDPVELIKDLEKNKVDYVVIDQVYGNTMRYLLPAVRQYPERFEQIYHVKNPDTFLLKFKR